MTPDPDSITAWMVRAMLRGEKLGEKDLRVRTTRYQDAVPFYLDYDFADVGATAANAVVKSWTGKGGKVAVEVALAADQAHHRLDEALRPTTWSACAKR